VMRIVAWALAAVAGVVVAVAISYAASTLSSQHVGLSSEPLTAGDRLVPRVTRTPIARPTMRATSTPTARPTAAATIRSPPPSDDGGGDD
jgi:hypothetical protein